MLRRSSLLVLAASVAMAAVGPDPILADCICSVDGGGSCRAVFSAASCSAQLGIEAFNGTAFFLLLPRAGARFGELPDEAPPDVGGLSSIFVSPDAFSMLAAPLLAVQAVNAVSSVTAARLEPPPSVSTSASCVVADVTLHADGVALSGKQCELRARRELRAYDEMKQGRRSWRRPVLVSPGSAGAGTVVTPLPLQAIVPAAEANSGVGTVPRGPFYPSPARMPAVDPWAGLTDRDRHAEAADGGVAEEGPLASVLLEVSGAAGVAAEALQFPIPGLSDILKIFMKLLMPPVFDPVLEDLQDHLEHTNAEKVGKDVNAATPKDTVNKLEPDLRRNLTNLLTDTVPAVVRAPVCDRLVATLAPGVIAHTVRHVDAGLSASLPAALHPMLSLRLTRTLSTALFRSLRLGLVPALTSSLSHALVPTLTTALKHARLRAADSAGPPAPGPHVAGVSAPFVPNAPEDVAVVVRHALAQCLDAASAGAAGLGGGGGGVSDPATCWAALSRTSQYGDVYRSQLATEYYSGYQRAYVERALALLDAAQFPTPP